MRKPDAENSGTKAPGLPDHVSVLTPGQSFQFACHPGVVCFNECCRQLELALSPYDVLCLKQALGMSSSEFLDQYAVIEQEPGASYPQVFLAMVDDGRASCPFVTPAGCRVYASRPGPCRTYPLGRAAFKGCGGRTQERHVLVREPHCQGFGEQESSTAAEWIEKQGLARFNAANDAVMAVLLHRRMRQGLTAEQRDKFLMALYDLDRFREYLRNGGAAADVIAADDTALLDFGIKWLQRELFGE